MQPLSVLTLSNDLFYFFKFRISNIVVCIRRSFCAFMWLLFIRVSVTTSASLLCGLVHFLTCGGPASIHLCHSSIDSIYILLFMCFFEFGQLCFNWCFF